MSGFRHLVECFRGPPTSHSFLFMAENSISLISEELWLLPVFIDQSVYLPAYLPKVTCSLGASQSYAA